MMKTLAALVVLVGMVLIGRTGTAYAGGAKSCVLGYSTATLTEVQCAAGSGTVYGIEFDSTTAAGSGTPISAGCFDTDKIGNSAVNASSDGTVAIPKIIGGSIDTTKLPPPITPRAFSNGLSCIKNTTGVIVRILYMTN